MVSILHSFVVGESKAWQLARAAAAGALAQSLVPIAKLRLFVVHEALVERVEVAHLLLLVLPHALRERHVLARDHSRDRARRVVVLGDVDWRRGPLAHVAHAEAQELARVGLEDLLLELLHLGRQHRVLRLGRAVPGGRLAARLVGLLHGAVEADSECVDWRRGSHGRWRGRITNGRC